MSAILVVDDEPEICDFIEFEIEEIGHTSISAHNGEDALIKLNQNSDIKVVISDVKMPKVDGIELLKKVKEQFPSVQKFILMTGFSEIDENEAKNLGAEALIAKPINFDRLLQLIDQSV